jgi:hypothetical protein
LIWKYGEPSTTQQVKTAKKLPISVLIFKAHKAVPPQIEQVSVDMYPAFIKGVEEYLPKQCWYSTGSI